MLSLSQKDVRDMQGLKAGKDMVSKKEVEGSGKNFTIGYMVMKASVKTTGLAWTSSIAVDLTGHLLFLSVFIQLCR